MFRLPPEFSELICVFSPTFSKKVFQRASLLLLGTILTRGKRTVCGVLRTLGLSQIRDWSPYHRVLSRANWSAFYCARALLNLLVQRLTTDNKLVFGIDETIERRWGSKIKARGIYRDAVRSSKSHFVKCSGLRWICLMLLTPIKWANRVWALPFLTVLAPSKRYHQRQGKKHKTLSDWARQMALVLHRWLPDYECIIVGDGSYSVMKLLASTRMYVTWITRFRMDAALYDFPPPRKPTDLGRPPMKGNRQVSPKERLEDESTEWQSVVFSTWYGQENKKMDITSKTAIWYRAGKPLVPLRWVLVRDPEGKIDPAVIQCTDMDLEPVEIVQHFVKRWQVEVTFEEVRAHLGVETQRQHSKWSIARTTPVLMALFSILTLWAESLVATQQLMVFQTTWYQKPHPTFSDVIASVRYRIWNYQFYLHSLKNNDCKKTKLLLHKHLAYMAARAA